MKALKRLLTEMFEDMGLEALNICTIIAGKGFDMESFLSVMSSLGLSSVFIMPEHVLRSHQFVAASFINPHREEGDEVSDGKSGGELRDNAMDANGTVCTHTGWLTIRRGRGV